MAPRLLTYGRGRSVSTTSHRSKGQPVHGRRNDPGDEPQDPIRDCQRPGDDQEKDRDEAPVIAALVDHDNGWPIPTHRARRAGAGSEPNESADVDLEACSAAPDAPSFRCRRFADATEEARDPSKDSCERATVWVWVGPHEAAIVRVPVRPVQRPGLSRSGRAWAFLLRLV